jgi:hypothetical protein
MKELQDYLDRINELNQYDLYWETVEPNPDVDEEWRADVWVLRESDNSPLCGGKWNEIIEFVRESLGFWGLEDA